MSGRIHVTPENGEVLSTEGAAIMAGLPHRTETDPLSMPTPPHHDNLDYDEIVFLLPTPGSDGPDPLNPRAGKIWVHGRSFPHGPPPGFETWSLPEEINSSAYMVDTLRPMKIAAVGEELNVADYYSKYYRD
jgi:homogentisate 1,2-dioxygenase